MTDPEVPLYLPDDALCSACGGIRHASRPDVQAFLKAKRATKSAKFCKCPDLPEWVRRRKDLGQ